MSLFGVVTFDLLLYPPPDKVDAVVMALRRMTVCPYFISEQILETHGVISFILHTHVL